MSSTTTWMLKQVIDFIIGKNVFGTIQSLVADVASNKDLSGSEKKAKVIETAQNIGIELASHLFNLAIEVAVTILKNKAATL